MATGPIPVGYDSPSFKACYKWKLPEFTSHHIDHLTNGFIQQEATKYSLYIPSDIINTCSKYYYNINILETIKTSPNGTGFKSNLFSVGPFKFYMDVFPNGYDAQSIGNIDWFLNLSSITPKIHKIAFNYQIEITELNHKYTNVARLTHEELSVGWDEVKISEIQHLKSLSFVIYIIINALYYENDDESVIHQYQHLFNTKSIQDITEQQRSTIMGNIAFYKAHSPNYTHDTHFIETYDIMYGLLPSGCGSWSIYDNSILNAIKCAKNGEKFQSEIFVANGFKWSLRMYPNGTGDNDIGRVDLGIYLVSLSPNISKLWIQYKILLHETGTYREDTVGFAPRAMGYLFITKLSFEELQKLNKLTFNAEIMIFDVYDRSGKVADDTIYNNMHNVYLDNIKTAQYQWKVDVDTIQMIKRSEPGVMFLSDFFMLHGFKWFLELYPKGAVSTDNNDENDVNLYLTLLSIPPKLSCISLSFELCLKEKEAKYGAFEQMGSKCMSYGWPGNIVKTSDIMELNEMTFDVTITLIDVYDDKGIAIGDKEESKEDKDSISGVIALPTNTYKWIISDSKFINKIHCAENAEYFPSDIFVLHSLKWVMQICPNGSSPSRMGHFNWYLHLASLPTKISKMYIFYRIFLEETQSLYEYRTIFECRQPGKGWGNDKLQHKTALELNTFTFKLDIMMIDIFDNNGNKMNDKYKEYRPCIELKKEIKDSFEWAVDLEQIKMTFKNGTHFDSPIFKLCGFRWFFKVFPRGINKDDINEFKLHIQLATFPFEIMSGLSCHFQLFVHETNTIYSDFAHFRKGFLFDGWQSSRIKTEQIINLDTLTIKVTMKVIDVYNENGIPITDKYVNNVDMFLCDTFDVD